MKHWLALILALGISANAAILFHAHANDSVAELRAGGVVLQRSNSVSMQSEDLFISREQIRVRYVYRNLTPQPVTLTVAFPLPDREPLYFDYKDLPETDGSIDFVGFITKIDGARAALTPQLQAMLNGRDVSGTLTRMGLLLAPDSFQTGKKVSQLTPAQKSILLRAGLINAANSPRWTLKTSFVRQQTFPVGRDIIVEHEYKPGVGGMGGGPLTYTPTPQGQLARYQQKYCVDDPFLVAARRLGKRTERDERNYVAEAWVSYILKTGANWARPIGRFRLVVDKGSPDVLVSFCGQNIRKISPTQFEVVRTNWRPDKDLDVLFLVPGRSLGTDGTP